MATQISAKRGGSGGGSSPDDNYWRYYTSNYVSTRPPGQGSTFGVTVTPGNNAKGAWAQVLAPASVAKDCYLVKVEINSFSVSTAVRDTLVDIGVDAAGGTNYSVAIPDLLGSASNFTSNGFGYTYVFPLRVPAGASVAARASVNNAIVGTGKVNVSLWGDPSQPTKIKYGTAVRSYGITSATSQGTAVTPGTVAEGAWAALGTIAGGDSPFWWQCGVGVSNGVIASLNYFVDFAVGDAGTKNVLFNDIIVGTGVSENIWYQGACVNGIYLATPGQIAYMRAQCSGTPDTGFYGAAWGVVP